MKIKLSFKIAAFTGALLLAVSAGIGLISVSQSSKTVKNAAEQATLEYAEASALWIEENIQANLNVLYEVAQRARVQTMVWATQRDAMKADVDRLGYLDIGVVSPDGSTIYVTDEYKEDLKEEPAVVTAFTGKNAVSDVYFDDFFGKVAILEASPILKDGVVIGVLVGIRDGESLCAMTDRLGTGEKGYAFVVGKDGTIYSHKNREYVAKQHNVFDDITNNGTFKGFGLAFQKLGMGNSGMASYAYDGDTRITAIVPIPDSNWVLGIGSYESEFMAPVNNLRNIIILIAFVLLLIGIVLAFILGIIIVKPIKQSLVMMQEIGHGHYGMRLNVKTKDEVGDMGRTLNKLADDLQFVVLGIMKKIAVGDVSDELSTNDELDEMTPALAGTISAVRALVNDANMLATAAIEGRLSTRADASKHKGEYANVVDGVNKTLDAVINPVQEASNVLNKMAEGNLKVRMTGNYNGDLNEIKTAMNSTLNALEGYVGEISETLTEMANSNMAVSINRDYKGDFNPIKDALNLIIDSFNQVLYDMNNAADQVASGSKQVSDGSQELSQGATEQAGAIEELTTSIGDIAGKTKQNAMRANEASELAAAAKEKAEQGNIQMQALQKAMEEINQSSANISKIIKVIDDIAFQTNILALNAAVEAARAGQHGKGFAVVAEEVRNLAARSANAANETTALIEGSIKKVGAGTAIADGTAKALEQIVTEVTKAASLVVGIAEASNEQASNITQINQGVEQVSQVVQSNSATAEESAAASEELSSQAELLKEMIGQFQLKTDRKNHR